ncbi:M48 family metallopeptidase [Cohaesibacter celericrescens]|uniref:M48 family metallopeptidase n=1 Tax=Cohaesibacter celericrescens TaxID=2067669 RepID=UPI003564992C
MSMFSQESGSLRKIGLTKPRSSLPQQVRLTHARGPIDVQLKHNARAKRLILRLDGRTGEPVATCPPGISVKKVSQFLQAHVDWLVDKQQGRPPNVAFEHGAVVPIRDQPHTLEHLDQARGTVRVLEDEGEKILLVSGNESHMARRVTDWLKKEARADLSAAVALHSDKIGVKPSSLRIKDTTSRWGSCSSARVLSFSWRIIMAPPSVLNYLAAHEVAHLREMNHSDRFWAHVQALCPDYEEGKKWLRQNGRRLHTYGVEPE